MSQFYIGVTAGSLPPEVPLQFTTDDTSIAVPASNNLNVFGGQSTDNNPNGIQTTANPNGSDNLYIELTNRQTSTATTTDGATPVLLYSLNLGATPGTYLLEEKIVAYNVTDALSASYTSFKCIRTTGAAATLISGAPGFISEETTMSGVSVLGGVSTNSAITTVTGLSGKTIHWYSLITFTFIS